MKDISEADLYLRVANELKDNQRDEGLWTKAFALENGNEVATKAHYIRLRVAQLSDEQAKASSQDKLKAFTEQRQERIEAAYKATPTPETHVHCPDCRKLIPNEETACRFCGCRLIPQAHKDSVGDAPQIAAYKAFIGNHNQNYYLPRFTEFEKASGITPSWNWASFIFSGAWALYRKMYGWFFAFCVVAIVSNIILNAIEHSTRAASGGVNLTLLLVLMAPQVLFGFLGNWFYFAKFKKVIAQKGNAPLDPSNALGYLQAIGGVHVWVRWLGLIALAVSILGIVAAVALPAYNDYLRRSTQQPIGQAPVSPAPIDRLPSNSGNDKSENVAEGEKRGSHEEAVVNNRPFSYEEAVGTKSARP